MKKKSSMPFFRSVVSFVLMTFISSLLAPSLSFAQGINLPVPGTMVMPSEGYVPALIRGITIHPENPLKYDFIIDTGHSGLQGQPLEEESAQLIKYFLASLTVPENELWVNLSPYEKERIASESFGRTEMGRDLLGQDYILKQLTSSLLYPESGLGKEFWSRVHEKARAKFGDVDVPVNTFNKVWIIPQDAQVYEHENSAFVIKSRLKVMLEEDYMALKQDPKLKAAIEKSQSGQTQDVNALGSQVVREIIIPEIEKEVNEGENFATLRQIYNSMILATWFKNTLKQSLLGQVYVDKNKVLGVDSDDPQVKEKIYQQYLEAYTQGVYNYIKEDVDPVTNDVIPRKYFSGGFTTVDDKGLTLADKVRAGTTTDVSASSAIKDVGKIFSATTDVTESPASISQGSGSRVLASMRKGIAATALLLAGINAAAVTPEAAKFFSDNNVLFGYPITDVQRAGQAYDKFLNPIIATNNGRIVLLQGVLQTTGQRAYQVGGNIRDKIKDFPASPKSFDEVAKAIRAELAPRYAKFTSGLMTPTEVQQLATLESDLANWLNGFLAIESQAVYDPTIGKRQVVDKKAAIRAQAQYRFIVYNDSINKGEQKTYICRSFAEQMVVLGNMIGLRPEALTLMYLNKDEQGKIYPDQNGEGHEDVLFTDVSKQRAILDQGYSSQSSEKLRRWQLQVLDAAGREVMADLALLNAQPALTGINFRQLLATQETELKVEGVQKNMEALRARAMQSKDKTLIADALQIFDQAQALLKADALNRGGVRAQVLRFRVIDISILALGSALNVIVNTNNLQGELINQAKVAKQSLPDSMKGVLEGLLPELQKLKDRSPQITVPEARKTATVFEETGRSALAQTQGAFLTHLSKVEDSVRGNLGIVNANSAVKYFVDSLNNIFRLVNQKQISQAKAAMDSMNKEYPQMLKRLGGQLPPGLKENIQKAEQYIAYKELEIALNSISPFNPADQVAVGKIQDIYTTASQRANDSNISGEIRNAYNSLAQGIGQVLPAIKKKASSAITVAVDEFSAPEISEEQFPAVPTETNVASSSVAAALKRGAAAFALAGLTLFSPAANAVTPETAAIYANNQASYKKPMTIPQAQAELDFNFDVMFTKFKSDNKTSISTLAPWLRSIVSASNTFADFSQRVSQTLKAETDKNKLTVLQKNVLQAVYLLVKANTSFDIYGQIMDDAKVGNYRNFIVGNPNYGGKTRTIICQTITEFNLPLLTYELGFDPEKVTAVEVLVNFEGLDTSKTGGHTANLIEFPNGELSMFDVVQGSAKNLGLGVAHKVIVVKGETQGEKVDLSKTALGKALSDGRRGNTVAELVEYQEYEKVLVDKYSQIVKRQYEVADLIIGGKLKEALEQYKLFKAAVGVLISDSTLNRFLLERFKKNLTDFNAVIDYNIDRLEQKIRQTEEAKEKPAASSAIQDQLIAKLDYLDIDNTAYRIRSEKPRETSIRENEMLDTVLEIGYRDSIWAHGVEEDKDGLRGIINIALEGQLRANADKLWFVGLLARGNPDIFAGSHGPFYVILNGFNGEDFKRRPQADEDFRYFLFPGEMERTYAQEIVKAAVEDGVITAERGAKILPKMITYQEFIDQNGGSASSSITKADKNVGGINLDPTLLNLQIKRDPNGAPLPLMQQPIKDMNIEGFYPVIINITPVNGLPMLLGANK